jgi:hypothetical protein
MSRGRIGLGDFGNAHALMALNLLPDPVTITLILLYGG